MRRENAALRAATDPGEGGSFHGLIGASEPMQRIFETISRVAPFRSTILISGESGTGKELAAQAIHALSDRADGPMVAVNCGAIPEALLESELFGHKRAPSPTPHGTKPGLFEAADGGTLFLDEIAELPLNTQVKLLRVLQDGEVRRVGENHSSEVNVRIIAASLHDLGDRVEEGLFREDLFYRLNVIHLRCPHCASASRISRRSSNTLSQVQNARQGTQIEGVSRRRWR